MRVLQAVKGAPHSYVVNNLAATVTRSLKAGAGSRDTRRRPAFWNQGRPD